MAGTTLVQFSAEQYRALDLAFDAGVPNESECVPVPTAVVIELRYKLLAAEASRAYALDFSDEEACVLSMCFRVGAKLLELSDETYKPIRKMLP
jgi:hypothetical protein